MSTSELMSEDFQFRALMENTEDSIYFKDRECRLLRVSRRMADNLGFADVSELVGKTDVDLLGEAFGQRTLLEDLRDHVVGRTDHRAGREPGGRAVGGQLDADDQGAPPRRVGRGGRPAG